MIQNDASGAAYEAAEETPEDRRRYRRVAVNLPGRYMLDDGTEHPCLCVDVSVGGVRLRAAQSGDWGSRVIAYIEDIGRIEGYIVRRAPGWFAMEMRGSARKGERVRERIAMILQSEGDAGSDRRRQSREGTHRYVTLFTLDGRQHQARLADISREGAALLIETALDVGERVRLDSRRARVARLFPGGVALTFENWADECWPRREPAAPPVAPRARRA